MTSGDLEPQPEQTDEAGAPSQAPGAAEPGGLLWRFLARLIDGLIINVVTFAFAFAIGVPWNGWIAGLFSGVLTFVYFVALETTQGWTPGKKVLGLSVHGPAGAPRPTVPQSAIRNVWTLFNVVPLVGMWLTLIAIIAIAVTIYRSPTNQGLHDQLAGHTQVVKG